MKKDSENVYYNTMEYLYEKFNESTSLREDAEFDNNLPFIYLGMTMAYGDSIRYLEKEYNGDGVFKDFKSNTDNKIKDQKITISELEEKINSLHDDLAALRKRVRKRFSEELSDVRKGD